MAGDFGMAAIGDPDVLARRVTQVREGTGIPGLAIAVSVGERIISAASGVLNIETGVEARSDSLFQIGSVTKSMTATLIMQAADEGLIDIDAPVKDVVTSPVGRGEHAGRFTARQLMAHMSGLDGDLFADNGRDDDAIAKYMLLCADLEFVSPPGRYYNYCNAGYAVLGRMLEIVRGDTYDNILRKQLFAPLGADRSTTFPEEAAFRRAAVGHSDGALVPPIALPRALGPAGLSLYSTVEELVAYANAHMSGDKLLSRKSQHAMRTAHATLPEGASWGLGWKLIKRGAVQFAGHDGGTIGQASFLWLLPEHGLAVAMCANGGRARQAWDMLAHPFFRDACGEIPESAVPEPQSDPVDLSPFAGTYDNLGVRADITAETDRLKVVAKQKAFPLPDIVFYMRPLGADRFRAKIGDDDKVVTAFHDRGPDGRPALFYAGRLHRRVKD